MSLILFAVTYNIVVVSLFVLPVAISLSLSPLVWGCSKNNRLLSVKKCNPRRRGAMIIPHIIIHRYTRRGRGNPFPPISWSRSNPSRPGPKGQGGVRSLPNRSEVFHPWSCLCGDEPHLSTPESHLNYAHNYIPAVINIICCMYHMLC